MRTKPRSWQTMKESFGFNIFNMATNTRQDNSTHQRFLTVKQVATILDVSKDYVRKLLREGHLNGIKMPGNSMKAPVRIDKASLDDFLQTHKVTVSETPYPISRKQKKRQTYHGIFSNGK
ncbi:helix-turn-helix domain-containing protein [Planctomycetota bacterium]